MPFDEIVPLVIVSQRDIFCPEAGESACSTIEQSTPNLIGPGQTEMCRQSNLSLSGCLLAGVGLRLAHVNMINQSGDISQIDLAIAVI